MRSVLLEACRKLASDIIHCRGIAGPQGTPSEFFTNALGGGFSIRVDDGVVVGGDQQRLMQGIYDFFVELMKIALLIPSMQ